MANLSSQRPNERERVTDEGQLESMEGQGAGQQQREKVPGRSRSLDIQLRILTWTIIGIQLHQVRAPWRAPIPISRGLSIILIRQHWNTFRIRWRKLHELQM